MAGEGGAIFNTGLAAAGSMVVGAAKGHQGRKFARENREYATEMANTAYQRATTDMRAAGLNPMLMYGSGGAAQTVQGAQPDMGAPMGPESSSARRVAAEIGVLLQSTATGEATEDKIREETKQIEAKGNIYEDLSSAYQTAKKWLKGRPEPDYSEPPRVAPKGSKPWKKQLEKNRAAIKSRRARSRAEIKRGHDDIVARRNY